MGEIDTIRKEICLIDEDEETGNKKYSIKAIRSGIEYLSHVELDKDGEVKFEYFFSSMTPKEYLDYLEQYLMENGCNPRQKGGIAKAISSPLSNLHIAYRQYINLKVILENTGVNFAQAAMQFAFAFHHAAVFADDGLRPIMNKAASLEKNLGAGREARKKQGENVAKIVRLAHDELITRSPHLQNNANRISQLIEDKVNMELKQAGLKPIGKPAIAAYIRKFK